MAQKDKQGLPKHYDPLTDSNVVASATECTGLTPSAVLDEGESDAYSEIYPVSLPENKVNNKLQTKKGIHGEMTKPD